MNDHTHTYKCCGQTKNVWLKTPSGRPWKQGKCQECLIKSLDEDMRNFQ